MSQIPGAVFGFSGCFTIPTPDPPAPPVPDDGPLADEAPPPPPPVLTVPASLLLPGVPGDAPALPPPPTGLAFPPFPVGVDGL